MHTHITPSCSITPNTLHTWYKQAKKRKSYQSIWQWSVQVRNCLLFTRTLETSGKSQTIGSQDHLNHLLSRLFSLRTPFPFVNSHYLFTVTSFNVQTYTYKHKQNANKANESDTNECKFLFNAKRCEGKAGFLMAHAENRYFIIVVRIARATIVVKFIHLYRFE